MKFLNLSRIGRDGESWRVLVNPNSILYIQEHKDHSVITFIDHSIKVQETFAEIAAQLTEKQITK